MYKLYSDYRYKKHLPILCDMDATRLGIVETTPSAWRGVDASRYTYYCEKFNMGFGVHYNAYYRPYIVLFNRRNVDDATKIAAISLKKPEYVIRDEVIFERDRWKLTREEINNFAELMVEKCVFVTCSHQTRSVWQLLCHMNNMLLMHFISNMGEDCTSNIMHVHLFADSANYIKYVIPYQDVEMPHYRRLYAYKKS